EVPLAVAELDVGETVERVRKRALVPSEHLDGVREERRLAAPRLARSSDGTDHVAEMDVELAGPARVADQLDAARAVDQVDEDELPHPAARHGASRDPACLIQLAARLERLALGEHARDIVPIGEALGRGHDRGRLAAAPAVPQKSAEAAAGLDRDQR